MRRARDRGQGDLVERRIQLLVRHAPRVRGLAVRWWRRGRRGCLFLARLDIHRVLLVPIVLRRFPRVVLIAVAPFGREVVSVGVAVKALEDLKLLRVVRLCEAVHPLREAHGEVCVGVEEIQRAPRHVGAGEEAVFVGVVLEEHLGALVEPLEIVGELAILLLALHLLVFDLLLLRVFVVHPVFVRVLHHRLLRVRRWGVHGLATVLRYESILLLQWEGNLRMLRVGECQWGSVHHTRTGFVFTTSPPMK